MAKRKNAGLEDCLKFRRMNAKNIGVKDYYPKESKEVTRHKIALRIEARYKKLEKENEL